MEISKFQLQDSCKEGRRGTLYSTGLSRQRMPWADVTMENSRVNTLLLPLVWVRRWGDRRFAVAPAYPGPSLNITQGPRAVCWVRPGGVPECQPPLATALRLLHRPTHMPALPHQDTHSPPGKSAKCGLRVLSQAPPCRDGCQNGIRHGRKFMDCPARSHSTSNPTVRAWLLCSRLQWDTLSSFREKPQPTSQWCHTEGGF